MQAVHYSTTTITKNSRSQTGSTWMVLSISLLLSSLYRWWLGTMIPPPYLPRRLLPILIRPPGTNVLLLYTAAVSPAEDCRPEKGRFAPVTTEPVTKLLKSIIIHRSRASMQVNKSLIQTTDDNALTSSRRFAVKVQFTVPTWRIAFAVS